MTTAPTAPANNPVEKAPSQWGNIIMSAIMAAIGLTFIFLCERHEVQKIVLFAAALTFIIPGVSLLLSLLVNRKKPRGSVMSFMTAVCGLAAIAIGVVLLVSPESFRGLLVYLFGGLLIVASAWQFDVMLRKNRGVLYPAWLIIGPVLIVALGVVMCTLDTFRGETNEKWMLLAAGIGFAVFGLIGLCISYYAIKQAHMLKKQAAAEANKPEATETSETPETSDKSENSENSEKSDKTETSEKSENSVTSETSDF